MGQVRHWLVRMIAVVLLVGATGFAVGSGAASAAPAAQTWWINSCGMPTQSPGGPPGTVKVRAWTRPGNAKTVVLLDGLRATNDESGWEHNTNVADLADHGVNVVEPVGGYESFYTDWDSPDNFSHQTYTYKWGCVIGDSLVAAMDQRGLRGPSGKYAIMGVSMSGSSALIFAATEPQNYGSAGSMSGLLHLTAPMMRTAIRAALIEPALDGGTPAMNVDCMWGPPWSIRWFQNDPLWQLGALRSTKLFIYTGSGIPGFTATPQALLRNPALLVQGAPLELLTSAQTHVFDLGATLLGVPHTTDFPVTGLHDWPYWQNAVWTADSQGFFA